MALDQPASSDALWGIYNATGIRPEWLLPVLYFESGFNPGASNGPYVGLNQISSDQLSAWGIDAGSYASWSASQQLENVVKRYFVGIQNTYGPLRSATRIEQANFLPVTLKTATSLSSTLTSAPSPYYESNQVFDRTHKGFITVQDLADAMTKAAGSRAVQSAISAAYAGKLFDSPTDPVYGYDFGGRINNLEAIGIGVALVGLAGALAYASTVPKRRRPAVLRWLPA